MNIELWVIFSLVVVSLIPILYVLRKKHTQKKFIEAYIFPSSIIEKISSHYPHLDPSQLEKVIYALRLYFKICCDSDDKAVAMTSKVVDIAWYEFIQMEYEYFSFCQKAFGYYLKYLPSRINPSAKKLLEAKSASSLNKKRIERSFQPMAKAWGLSCKLSGINPHRPRRMPLLFEIDQLLEIPDGFKYSYKQRIEKTPINSSEDTSEYLVYSLDYFYEYLDFDGSGDSGGDGGGD